MKKQAIIFFFIFFVSSHFLSGQNVSFNTNCQQAYKQILALHLDSAGSLLSQETKSDTGNAYVPYLENYISFVSLFVSQDRALYNELKSSKSKYFNEVEKLDDTCRYKKWMLGNMHLQWAVLKIMFGDYISAAFEVNSAYHLIEDNTREFPDFQLNNLSLSVLKIIVGLVPQQYNWFLGLLSMKGDIEKGKKQLDGFLSVTKSDSLYAPYYYEALFYSAFIEMNIHPDQKKLSYFINEAESINNDVTLITFLQINLFMRTGENQKALDLIRSMESANQNMYPFFYINYLHGECLLRARRFEESIDELDLFTTYFRGENYIKDAWRKKAWAAFMLQDTLLYHEYMEAVILKGAPKIDIDQEALTEAKNEQLPGKDLLLSRILFDGGYYSHALQILNETDTSNFSDEEKVSFKYRVARVYHQMKYIEKAKKYYKTTIDYSAVTDNYYAANAALKLGEIYEAEGNLSSAKDAYATCLNMDYKQYRNSIHSRAREGLKRVSE